MHHGAVQEPATPLVRPAAALPSSRPTPDFMASSLLPSNKNAAGNMTCGGADTGSSDVQTGVYTLPSANALVTLHKYQVSYIDNTGNNAQRTVQLAVGTYHVCFQPAGFTGFNLVPGRILTVIGTFTTLKMSYLRRLSRL